MVETLNAVDGNAHLNLERFLESMMFQFPVSFAKLVEAISAPERPAFAMVKDETTFMALEASVAHMGVSKLAVEIVRTGAGVLEDKPSIVWLKANDPQQRINEILIKNQELVFNDVEREERYFVTKNCLANLAYARSGEAILCLVAPNRTAVERYTQTSSCRFNGLVSTFLDTVGQS